MRSASLLPASSGEPVDALAIVTTWAPVAKKGQEVAEDQGLAQMVSDPSEAVCLLLLIC